MVWFNRRFCSSGGSRWKSGLFPSSIAVSNRIWATSISSIFPPRLATRTTTYIATTRVTKRNAPRFTTCLSTPTSYVATTEI